MQYSRSNLQYQGKKINKKLKDEKPRIVDLIINILLVVLLLTVVVLYFIK